MKNIFKTVAFIALTGLFFTSCQKEENLLPEKQINQDVVTSGYSNKKAVINGQTYVFEKPIKPNGLKGMLGDESVWLVSGQAYQAGNINEQYQTLKVYRPNGRYFYIMIENLRINPNNNGSWVYDNDDTKVAKYGRLYDWQTANDLRLQVYMKLPMINASNGQIIRPNLNIRGHLPTITDIQDLLEVSSVGNLPSNGSTLDDVYSSSEWYYDVFLAGFPDVGIAPAGAYHTLAGWRENMDANPDAWFEYLSLNEIGRFWLNDGDISGFHYPLSIWTNYQGTSYDYVAFINTQHADRFGFSVRYVFEPIYR